MAVRSQSVRRKAAGQRLLALERRRELLDIAPEPSLPATPREITPDSTDEEIRQSLDTAIKQVATEALAPEADAPSESRPVLESNPNDPTAILPARMLNEFVYCKRLFYYEFVEDVFVHSADTLRGKSLHARVDAGTGELPPAKAEQPDEKASEPETIHSRSVQLSSERLGVTAKMDLVEVRIGTAEDAENFGELFARMEVCPVDYKAGSPREGNEGKELWDTDKIQLGLQCLILRDNGYACHEGIIYYRGTKQRVRLEITQKLEAWIIAQIAAARETALGPIPPPLEDSPKCIRCSLAPVCLPDETRLLKEAAQETDEAKTPQSATQASTRSPLPRRLIAAREDRRALYLNTPGLHVGRSGEVLQVREKKQLLDEFRLANVCHIALFGNIQITTQTIQTLCEAEVPVTYFSMGGWFYGITRGHALKNVFLRIEQFRQAAMPNVCLRLACSFIQGKICNHRTMLMRNHTEPPAEVLRRLKGAIEDCLRARSLPELLGIEGAAAALYFKNFQGMIKANADDDYLEGIDPPPRSEADMFTFDFNHRNRRPPTDPVNALLSLAYSLLSKDCTLAAHAVGFDPYVGFYHQPRFGRPALALDIMEEFRPLIAESAVLTAINNRMITSSDFVRAGHAVNLSSAGRRQFFNAYEQRMNHLIIHPLFDYKISYRRALELQFRVLARALTGEVPEYIPFTTR